MHIHLSIRRPSILHESSSVGDFVELQFDKNKNYQRQHHQSTTLFFSYVYLLILFISFNCTSMNTSLTLAIMFLVGCVLARDLNIIPTEPEGKIIVTKHY